MLFSKACSLLLVFVTLLLSSFTLASGTEVASLKEPTPQGSIADRELQVEGETRGLSEPIYVAPAGKIKLVVYHDANPRETSWVLKKALK
jgi:hypothetical protein